mgnify:CR=1 FL=1
MNKYHIPTAEFETFTSFESAKTYILNSNWECFVVKQSSLAAGKGVIIANNKNEAIKASSELLNIDTEILIEEFLEGQEVSYFAICLGEDFKVLGDACDYKRLKDNNQGPNTGGMGCYSPAYWLSADQSHQIKTQVLIPTLQAMKSENLFFKGVLFIGLMMTKDGPKTLEYNIRFGDPETQTILPLISAGFTDVIQAVAFQNKEGFRKTQIKHNSHTSVHIVKASKGYPGINGEEIEINKKISNNILLNKNLHLYFAGVKKELSSHSTSSLLTSGGRVLGITSIAEDLKDARSKAYQQIKRISFDGEQYREDIGQ